MQIHTSLKIQSSALTYAWNALHWDLSHTLFEAGEAWVNLPDLALFPLNQLLYNLIRHLRFMRSAAKTVEWKHPRATYLFLSFYDVRELGVGDPRVQLTLHERRPLVIFDVSQVAAFRHFDVFGKTLRGGKRSQREGPEEHRWHGCSTCFLK